MEKTVTVGLKRVTKSTAVYDEVTNGQPPMIQGWHIALWATGTPPPQQLEVSIKSK